MKSKKTTVLLLIICFAFNKKVLGQTAGSYLTNTTMEAFHGTWQWVSGTDTVKLYLVTKKVFFNLNGGFYWDCLVGWHSYKKGNTLIESSLPHINNIDFRTFLGGNEGTSNPNVIDGGTLKDISKKKEARLSLMLNATQNQIIWRLTEHQGMRIYGGGRTVPPPGLTLPRNLLLTKL